jgi:hypothetical protein
VGIHGEICDGFEMVSGRGREEDGGRSESCWEVKCVLLDKARKFTAKGGEKGAPRDGMWIVLHLRVAEFHHDGACDNEVYDTQLTFTMNKKIICSRCIVLQRLNMYYHPHCHEPYTVQSIRRVI